MLASHVLGQWWHRTCENDQAVPGLTSGPHTMRWSPCPVLRGWPEMRDWIAKKENPNYFLLFS